MASYTNAELARLDGTLPETRAKERTLRDRAERELGIVYVIPPYGGERTPADQAQLVKWRDEAVAAAREKARRAGKSAAEIERAGKAAWYPVAPVASGKHPKGGAFDVKIVKHRETTNDRAYRKLADLARSIGLTAGYYFSRPDPFHFELPLSVAELARRFDAFSSTPIGRASLGAGAVALAGVGVAIVTRGSV